MKKFKPIIIGSHNAGKIAAIELALNKVHERIVIVDPPEPEKILTEELKTSLLVTPILNSISLSQDYSKKVNYSCIKKKRKRKKRKKTHGKRK